MAENGRKNILGKKNKHTRNKIPSMFLNPEVLTER